MKSSRPSAPIDWTAVRARLDQAQTATDEALDLSHEGQRALMEARTRSLARNALARAAPAAMLDTVRFDLGRERYAVDARFVRSVARLVDLTPVPGAPSFLLGITNLVGQVLPIVDLHALLGVPHPGLTNLGRVIVLGLGRPELGILADDADEMQSIAITEILQAPETVAGIDAAHLLGVTRDAVIVLDAARLLADPRLFIDQSDRQPELGS